MSAFIDACHGKPTSHTPIWLNRQAGRYMPEYHRLKGDTPSLTFFKSPDLAAQATLDAQRILGVDAAILFADLLPIVEPMGFDLDYVAGTGPVIGNRIETERDVQLMTPVCAEEAFDYIPTAIHNIREDLPSGIPLIGFAGAPFTLASYLIEGSSSKSFVRTKQFMYQHEASWNALLHKLVDVLIDYVKLQINAGAQAIQIFDSWVGCLSISDYQHYVFDTVSRLMQGIQSSNVPIIYFGTGNSHLCDLMASTGPSLLAVDWRTPLTATWQSSNLPAIQGNLDPVVLFGDRSLIKKEVDRILREVDSSPGHIFNLGHGILPTTPVDNVKYLVDYVQETSALIRN